MALSKAPSTAGAVTLELSFDAEGAVEQARLGSASPLGSSLDQCLLSVAEGWSLAAAAGASASVPLTLSVDSRG